MKIKYLILIVFCNNLLCAQAQQMEGVVIYQRRSNWPKIMANMTWLNQEEKDRAVNTWKNNKEWKEDMKLLFSPNASMYTYNNEQSESVNRQWSWRNKDLIFYRNFNNNKTTDLEEILGKKYIIDDTIRVPKWKILNEIKEFADHICMKAETFDPIKNHKIVAWFAQDIPVPAGPERYTGLPGLILGISVNDGDVHLEAIKVEFKAIEKEITVPTAKGRRIRHSDYDLLISHHIVKQIKAKNNPWWALRL